MTSGTMPATIVREVFADGAHRSLIELGELVDRINVHFKFFNRCQTACNSRFGFLQAGRTEKCKRTRFFSYFVIYMRQFSVSNQVPRFGLHFMGEAVNKLLTFRPRLRSANKHE